MIGNAAHIAAVTGVGIATVCPDGKVEAFQLLLALGQSLGETVGHKKIKHIARTETLMVFGSHRALP